MAMTKSCFAIFAALISLVIGVKEVAAGWQVINSGTENILYSVWGSSSSDVFAVGSGGTILHYNGSQWSTMNSGTSYSLRGVWGTSNSDVFAAGGVNGGISDGIKLVLHYDGSNWNDSLNIISQGEFLDVWGSAHSDVFAGGRHGIYHYDGTNWSSMPNSNGRHYDIWGSSGTNVFTVTVLSRIFHYDGSTWQIMNLGYGTDLYGIWGSSSSDIFAVGLHGIILHFDGNTWSSMNSVTEESLNAVWGSSSSDVFAVGYNGLILHYIPDNFTLHVSTAGTGNGTVISSPAGIDCGIDCSELYRESTVVNLTAVADSDSVFKGWSTDSAQCQETNDCPVAMYSETSVTAEFARTYSITTSSNCCGRILPGGTLTVEQGSSQTFTMIPVPGYFISEVVVDGASIGAVSEYAFTNVTADHTISVVFGSNLENFESGFFNRYPWVSSGAGIWSVQDNTFYDGTYAGQAPTSMVGDQASNLRVRLCVGAAMDISFYLKVSSEEDYDFLKFKIDGVEMGRWSGEVEWTKVSYPVSVGPHIFMWIYSKDAEVSKGSDTAWIDRIFFPKAQPCPSESSGFYVIPNKTGGGSVIYLQ